MALEILSAIALPSDAGDKIRDVLRVRLSEQVADGIIDPGTAEVFLKAADPSPEKRWQTVKDFADALEQSIQHTIIDGPSALSPTATVSITEPFKRGEAATVQVAAETAEWPQRSAKEEAETADTITPLDLSHEIWNNHYEIIEKIGEGGQAVVYKAYDHLTNEEIAVKTIWSYHRGDRAAINRLKQGAMIARSLTHRHIIKTYSVEQKADVDSHNRYVFICMELVNSQMDLGRVIEIRNSSEQEITLRETLHIIHQLLDALAYAHEYTIHRDIKPGNIMLVPRNGQEGIDTSDLTKFDIKLIDFGIAKVLSQKHIDVTGQGFRSAYYGAPELADARTGVDARADVYSAGVIMYQMLAKNVPRKGSQSVNKVNKDVPAALAKVIDRAISTDRDKRFKTASEFAKEIHRAVSKFNWVRKAAKIAAVLLVCGAVAGAVERLLPEPNYGSVQDSMKILEARDPNRRIAVLADNTPVKYADIEGYGSYDRLKQTALDNLKIVEDAGNDTFNTKRFSPWREQEEAWQKVGPAISKIETIARDQREYGARRDLPVVARLMELSPSSRIVSEVAGEAESAEKLLADRPISRSVLDACADAYHSAASVYTNVEALAGNSDATETAEQINNKLKNVEQLRDAFLQSRNSLEAVDEPRKGASSTAAPIASMRPRSSTAHLSLTVRRGTSASWGRYAAPWRMCATKSTSLTRT